VVDAAGAGVNDALVGRRVAFRSPGAWAEQAVVRVTRIYAVPDDIDDALACQFALNPLTAWGLLARAAVKRGEHVLLTAGQSIVAGLVAALAAQRRIAVTRVMRDKDGYRTEEA